MTRHYEGIPFRCCAARFIVARPQRGALPLLNLDHHGHLQPRHAEHVAGGSRRHRRGPRRVMAATWRQRSASDQAAGGVSAARLRTALVAQWREQRFPKPRVAGSIPAGGTWRNRGADAESLVPPRSLAVLSSRTGRGGGEARGDGLHRHRTRGASTTNVGELTRRSRSPPGTSPHEGTAGTPRP
jgi:hypothetical protein